MSRGHRRANGRGEKEQGVTLLCKRPVFPSTAGFNGEGAETGIAFIGLSGFHR
jgi:hypothetical protein